jgi:hypothetical protein
MPSSFLIRVKDIIPQFVQLQKKGKSNLVFLHTEAALEKLSTMYQETWMQAALGASLPGLPFVINSTNYQRTIQRKQISQYVWEIYSNYATKSGLGVTELLEKGHGPIDLKEGLLKGSKSRAGANGRYNIVSFRQGIPGTDQHRNNPMPLSVYRSFTQQVKKADSMQKAGASSIPGTSYTSKSADGGRAEYVWGSKYNSKSQIGRRSKIIKNKGERIGEYTWKAGKYAGMVRLQQSTSKSKRGGYFTFRVVSSRSDPMSWIVPEQDPFPIRQSVIDFMRPIAEGMLKEAMEADIT